MSPRTKGAILALASVLGAAGAAARISSRREIPPTTTIANDWTRFLVPGAEAQPAATCAPGIRRIEKSWRVRPAGGPFSEEHIICARSVSGYSPSDSATQVYELVAKVTRCDGTFDPPTGAGAISRCQGNVQEWCTGETTWQWPNACYNCQAFCVAAPPSLTSESIDCDGTCPEQDDCCDGKAGGNPISIAGDASGNGQGAGLTTLPVFPLGDAGFPPSFSVFLVGQSDFQSSSPGGPLGPRATHSLNPTLQFIVATPNAIRIATEEGDVLPFRETSPGVWAGEQGRTDSLTVTVVEHLATAGTPGAFGAVVTGTVTSTHAGDGVSHVIQETDLSGSPNSGPGDLVYTYSFAPPAGTRLFTVRGRKTRDSDPTEGFDVRWSTSSSGPFLDFDPPVRILGTADTEIGPVRVSDTDSPAIFVQVSSTNPVGEAFNDDQVAIDRMVFDVDCGGTAILARGGENGTRYTFRRSCGGKSPEGRIVRIDRPGGDFLQFFADVDGYVNAVENRRGARVTFTYGGRSGTLEGVQSPTGETFRFKYDGFLTAIEKVAP